MNYEVIVFALVLLFWIVRGIFRFFKWAGRQLTGGAAGTNPVQQALADAQRQSQVPAAGQGPPPAQAPRPAQTLPTRAPSLVSARPMPRQPQVGGPIVSREATDADFQRQEQELAVWETASSGSLPRSPAPNAVPIKALFGGSDDLVRAIILREALGPPLSRRRPAPPHTPRPDSPPQ